MKNDWDLRKRNPKKGDLVLLVAKEGATHPAILAVFDKLLDRAPKGDVLNIEVINSNNRNEEYCFANTDATILRSPKNFGQSTIPITQNPYLDGSNKTLYLTERVYVGKQEVIQALKDNPKLRPYARWISSNWEKSV